MENLNPDYIKENLQKIGIREASTLLKEWIVNSNIQRKKPLKLLGSIDDGKNFKFFEQLFLSDEDSEMRMTSGNILKEKYINHKQILSLLEFVLYELDNYEQKFLAVEILNQKDSKETRKVIKNYLEATIKAKLRHKFNEFPKEIFTNYYNSSLPQFILDICFNLILYGYYIYKCGYKVVIRKGFIILLDCEGSNLRSINNIVALNKLTNLKHLLVQRNNIERISSLENFKKLKTLNLSDNNITKIENLENLNNLEELELSYNKIKRIEKLDSLKSLKKLSLEVNLIENVDGLDKLHSLEELNLSNNKISIVRNLDSLKKLKRLNLSFNNIEKITGLNNFNSLIFLYLNDNNISKIEGFDILEKLKTLNLSNNSIKRIENMSNLINLKKFELSNNAIEKIEGLNNQINLHELFLDKNHIKELEGLNNLKNLIILFLENNDISVFNNQKISTLKGLNFIFLNENPLTPESWLCYKKRSRFP